jgi:hypothetical protein
MARSRTGSGLGSAEPRRLVDGGGATVKERLLLQAGISEAPPNGAGRRRTLAALGLGVGLSTVAGAAAAAVVPRSGVALGLTKWLIFGAVSAAVAVGTIEVAIKADSVPALAPSVATRGRTATLPSKSASPVESPIPLTPAASALLSPSVKPSASRPAEVASSPSELVAQVAALDQARAALAAGHASESLAQLDHFDRRYPRSALAPEATVVRVSALLSLGQRAQATKLVRLYCGGDGRRAYGNRLLALVGLSDTACEGSVPTP